MTPITSRNHPSAARRRLGVSIVEVLIAIGVATIGLLGLVVLITAAGLQARDGLRNDYAAAAGRQAFREIQVRQMTDSRNWVLSNGAPFAPTGPQPFCLDPMFVATAGSKNFPVGGGAMPRVTLRAHTLRPPLQALGGPMQQGPANEIFEFRDDLDFLPQPGAAPPVQQWVPGNAKRQAKGSLSWFATFSTYTPTTTVPQEYLVSVVIVANRNRDFANNLGVYDGFAERLLQVSFPNGVALGGGDVMLATTAGSPEEGRTALNLRVDNWIMLSTGNFARWYRITSIGELQASGSTYSRQATLAGADWKSPTAVAAKVDGVIAVFEKHYRVDQGSLWAP